MLKDRWLLICGHEPLYSYKPKKKKLFQKLTDVSSIFNALYELNYNKWHIYVLILIIFKY